MRSPFPGMDPYLEGYWNDVHGKLLAYIADDLNGSLPPNFRASMEKRLVIDDLESTKAQTRYPDVAVIELPGKSGPGGGTAVHSRHFLARTPSVIEYHADPITEYFVEIIDEKSGGRVVTAIELLSPENKRPGDGMFQFKQKQAEYRAAGVNRVEIDLLRRGQRPFDFPASKLGRDQVKPYYVITYRQDRLNEAELFAIDLRDPLPVIEIPLRAGDPQVLVELQPLMDRVYRNGRFPIDYTKPPEPPLEGADADWARELLAKSFA